MAGSICPPPTARRLALLLGLLGLAQLGAALCITGAWPAARAALLGQPGLAVAALLGFGTLTGLAALLLGRPRAEAGPAEPQFLDPLTGLLNQAGFREAVARASRACSQFGLLVIDLRHFREVNQIHGVAGGDAALRLTAGRLRHAMRRDDVLARLAGDRFAVLQSRLKDPEDTLKLANRLAATLAEPLPLGNGTALVEADIGIAIGPGSEEEPDVLLSRAEDALAAARSAPAPSIHRFAPEQEAALRERRQLERDLRDAIAAGAFQLHWQPQRRLADGALTGFEALLRWPHPERGMIPPDAFIPMAEATGLIVPLGAWVLRTATREAADWPEGLKLAVNLSAEQIKAEGLLASVAEALEQSGLPAHRLELEVTETVLMQDSQQAARVLSALRALGVSIALDDFGTGWSSLAYLQRFCFDELKIDRSFLRNLGADPRVEAVVTAILGLGRGLGIQVVAEGVETREQAERLVELGCEHGQGWLLGRPMPLSQARALIAAEAEPARIAAVA